MASRPQREARFHITVHHRGLSLRLLRQEPRTEVLKVAHTILLASACPESEG